jgi:hypothetical protein
VVAKSVEQHSQRGLGGFITLVGSGQSHLGLDDEHSRECEGRRIFVDVVNAPFVQLRVVRSSSDLKVFDFPPGSVESSCVKGLMKEKDTVSVAARRRSGPFPHPELSGLSPLRPSGEHRLEESMA